MGKGVIVIYRPKTGKDEDVLHLIREHLSLLRSQGLATERAPIVMKSGNGCFVEIFEWLSADAIQRAHTNRVVLKFWERLEAVCDYDIPVNVPEFHQLFSEFEVIDV